MTKNSMSLKKPSNMEVNQNGNKPSINLSVINLQDINAPSTDKLNSINYSKESINANEETYDPFSYRDLTHATTDMGAFLHLMKSSLGSGILAMPRAFRSGGLLFGLFGTAIIGIICTHCVAMLVRSSRVNSIKSKKPSLGFADTAETAFEYGPRCLRGWSKIARIFVNTMLFATYYTGNTVYIVLIALSFKQVIDNNFGIDMNVRLYILLVGIPLIPLGIGRRLKYLVPFSAIGMMFIFFGIIVTLYYIVCNLPPLTDRSFTPMLEEIPIFFSTILFAMEGIGTVLPIENSMKNPHRFLGKFGVLNVAMTVIVTLYASVGFLGYLKYGNETEGSVTLNLPQDPLAESVKILVALSILFSYGLQFCVPSEIVWNGLGKYVSSRFDSLVYYSMRATMIVGTVIIAIIVPNLAPFISFVGAVCFSILGLWTPAVIELVTYWDDNLTKLMLFKNVIVILLSIFSLVGGGYFSIIEIIHMYK